MNDNIQTFTHQEIIAFVESKTDANNFNCEILVRKYIGASKVSEKWYRSNVTRRSNLCWNFECSTNGLIQSVKVDMSQFKTI